MGKKTLQQFREAESRAKAASKRWNSNNKEHILNRSLIRRFGIDLEQFKSLLASQGGVCAICEKPESVVDRRTGQVKNLSVDHDHKTGKVRGLLCHLCNTAIGKLGDDPRMISKALKYLGGNI